MRRGTKVLVSSPEGAPRRSDGEGGASATSPSGLVGVVQGDVPVCGNGQSVVTGTGVSYRQGLTSANLGPPDDRNVQGRSAVLPMKLMRRSIY